ncbi:Zinc finger C2H2-type protein [Venturia nashicola]|uniref:Zinc finger C2H2-type protein n=1 Tax=Venturia nashicola TaxID=86259 RepID=A0A4Z1P177_9PEZI|nr:Zinc finger C2H2-type protein [Venturia nashicola]
MDSPGSPLSEHSDDEFQEQEEYTRRSHRSLESDHEDADSTRPAKRSRITGPSGPSQWENATPAPPEEDISSDSEGSVPGSPHLGATAPALGAEDDDYGGYGHREQVSICKWEGCEAGDLRNMDLLVLHLHDEHIHARQKKYSCEWADCSRKGISHASGYALRAHMRSHTREKPFYCTLPECDRSFTRSDALAKHMRTVHETEALRPSDPVPKHHSSNPQNKSQRVRLTFKGLGEKAAAGAANGYETPIKPEAPMSNASAPASPMTGPTIGPAGDFEYEHNNIIHLPAPIGSSQEYTIHFPEDVKFTDEELSLPPPQLIRLLKSQLQWAQQDGEVLRKEVEELDARRRREWTAKELALENTTEADLAFYERRLFAKGLPLSEHDVKTIRKQRVDAAISAGLEVTGGEKLPWWREADALTKKEFKQGVRSHQDVQTLIARDNLSEHRGTPIGEPVMNV